MFARLKCWLLDHFYTIQRGGVRCRRCGDVPAGYETTGQGESK